MYIYIHDILYVFVTGAMSWGLGCNRNSKQQLLLLLLLSIYNSNVLLLLLLLLSVASSCFSNIEPQQ